MSEKRSPRRDQPAGGCKVTSVARSGVLTIRRKPRSLKPNIQGDNDLFTLPKGEKANMVFLNVLRNKILPP